MGENVLWRKHTGRQDGGASQWSGDRTALRATAHTQHGLRMLLTLRWRGEKELTGVHQIKAGHYFVLAFLLVLVFSASCATVYYLSLFAL